MAGLGYLMVPSAGAYALVVGLAVAMPLLRAETVGLPDDPNAADRITGGRALRAAVGALVVGVGVVYLVRSSLPDAGVPLYVLAAAAAVAGSLVADLG
ncbi:MAG: hypothetical protein ABEJ81_06080 [Haloferacaceae archaeon]